MNKKRRRERQEQQRQRFAYIQSIEDEVRFACYDQEIRLKVSIPVSGKTETFHWMFETERGRRLLDYWPVTGSWWAMSTNDKGKTLDPYEAVALAVHFAGFEEEADRHLRAINNPA